jgi:hypothetical protein
MDSTGSSSSISAADGVGPDRADAVVGIASYNDEATIGGVVRAVREGIERFSGPTTCIVLADGGSTDRTVERAREQAGQCEFVAAPFVRPEIDPLKMPYHGRPGRAVAMRTVFNAARERDAKACAMLDAGLTSVSPEWIPLLIQPALAGEMDYVSAHYLRHPHEGAITKSIIYPLFRALYGKRLRQPAALEFACSPQLMTHFLNQDFWRAERVEVGIDLWLAAAAAGDGYRLGEALLGVRAAAPRRGAPDLTAALSQLLGAQLTDLEHRAGAWHRVRSSTPLSVIGEPPPDTPPAPEMDLDSALESYRLGYRALRDVWAWILPPRTILELKKLADMPSDRFRMADDVWARIIYDFALAHRLQVMPRDHLMGSLTPLYLGWLASFILETDAADVATADARIERLCAIYETQKPYLISRWRWPERFRS